MATQAAHAAVTVQYVRRRPVIRLVGADDGRSGTLEVPLPAFIEALRAEPGDLLTPSLYLLFACPQGAPFGGLGDLVATYPTEADARAAFHRLRTSGECGDGWAEVDEIGRNGHSRALCWFGRAPARDQRIWWRRGRKVARKDPRLGGASAVQ